MLSRCSGEERDARKNKLSYSDTGKGNAIVLIHGWGGRKELWQGQIDHLSRNFRVIALDLPGHGKSDNPEREYTMKHMADRVNAVLKDARVEKAVLFGFSMGSPVMCAFYKANPEKVAGLVSLDGGMRGYNFSEDQMKEWMEPYRRGEHHEPRRGSSLRRCSKTRAPRKCGMR